MATLKPCWNVQGFRLPNYLLVAKFSLKLSSLMEICSYERRGACSQIESFFPQSYTGIPAAQYLWKYWFFDTGYETKNAIFLPYNRNLWWPDPAMTLFDSLFLRQMLIYEPKISAKHGDWLWNCRIKFEQDILKSLETIAFFGKMDFAKFSYIFTYNFVATLWFYNWIVSHDKTS